jgi:hypothetical protein
MVERLHARYIDGVNRKRADELAGLFTADAVWDLGEYGTVDGAEAIGAWLGELFTHWAVIVHSINSSIVEPDPGGAAAHGRLWFTEYGIRDGSPRAMAGCFHDRYALGADGQWRFAARRHDIQWRYLDGAHEALPFPIGFDDWLTKR